MGQWISLLCSAYAAVGRALLSSHRRAEQRSCLAARTPLRAVCCFRRIRHPLASGASSWHRGSRWRIFGQSSNSECRVAGLTGDPPSAPTVPGTWTIGRGSFSLTVLIGVLHLQHDLVMEFRQCFLVQSNADRCYIAVILLPRRVSPAAGRLQSSKHVSESAGGWFFSIGPSVLIGLCFF